MDWTMFEGAMTVMALAIGFIFINGLATSVNFKVRIPRVVIAVTFAVALILLMQSVGFITNVQQLIQSALVNSNVPEFIAGIVLIVFSVYEKLYDIVGYKPSGWLRLTLTVFGVILVLDGLRILPILYYLSSFIAYAVYAVASMFVSYPWSAAVFVVMLLVAFTFLFVKFRGASA